ncbi:MAG: 2-amino-4-hydroxy-6-hydroxymethyldihydropteridine diphosphokinase [Trueperaceae bacterium]
MAPELALIGLGSNLEDPARQLRTASMELARCGSVEALSSLYRTAPVGGPAGQPDFLNAVLALAPNASLATPRAMLDALLAIERRHGRTRRVPWEARTLDLDLLAFGERTVVEPGLSVPHPRLLERAFVLAPLCEALPEWRHPLTGASACEALALLPSAPPVTRTGLDWDAG